MPSNREVPGEMAMPLSLSAGALLMILRTASGVTFLSIVNLMRTRRSVDLRYVLDCVALSLFAGLWYFILFDPTGTFAASRRILFLIGLVPVVAVAIVVLRKKELRFLPIAIVALAMISALRSPVHPLSPDITFHLGKTLWASAGRPLIDPVIGVTSGYPAAFHFLWGTIARWTSTNPQVLLRIVSIVNLIGLWLVTWLVVRRLSGRENATAALYVTSLALFTKDISEILFASPGSFSMPFALLGWFLWALPTRSLGTSVGAISLGVSILIWPTHLFGAFGVALVEGWRRSRTLKGWAYAMGVAISVLAVVWMRSAVPGDESWSGLQFIPSDLADLMFGRLAAVLSLGTHYYGWIPGLAGATLLLMFMILSWIGLRAAPAPVCSPLVRLGVGILFGALLSGWFLVTAAHMVRLEFVACMALVPLAGAGLLQVWQTQPRGWTMRSIPGWKLVLAMTWLIPFLAAASASTERLHQWHVRARPLTEYLGKHGSPGDRVWASPSTYRQIILGKVPLFGFLAHDWPLYFGAPRAEAHEYSDKYKRIEQTQSFDSARTELVRCGVRWIILRDSVAVNPQWYLSPGGGIVRDTNLGSFVLWRVEDHK